ncbi:MAG: PAS domain S-box protein [Gemmatimonadota bacterium]
MTETRATESEDELAELRRRLSEAQDTIDAIRTGIVDAFLIEEPVGKRVRALETADRPYRTLVETMREGALTVTSGGVVLYSNPYMAGLLGVTRESMRGRSFLDVVAEPHRAECQALLTAATQNPAQGELELVRADGTAVPVHLGFSPLPVGGSAVISILVSDLTQQRHYEALQVTQAALRVSEDRFRIALQHSPIVVFSQDRDLRYTWIHRPYDRSPEDVLGTTDAELLPPEAAVPLTALKREVMATGVGIRREVLAPHDGQMRCYDLTVEPVRDETGTIAGVTGAAMDVTDRKQSEEALRIREQQFRELADSMPQIVWAARPDGVIDYYNERFYDFTGISRDEAGPHGARLLHPDDVERGTAAYERSIKTGAPYEIEYRVKDRSSEGYRWYLDRALPIRDESGTIVRWFGTCTDVDEARRAMLALRDAEQSLREADSRKDEFLALLAHELRNPLGPALNALHLLRSTVLPDHERQRAHRMVDAQLRQMKRLVDDLLDISRITQDKLELKRERVELASTVAMAVESCRAFIEELGHELIVALPPVPIFLDADPLRLAQALSNLLNNAAKFSPAGGRIRVLGKVEGNDILVTVEDTGIGITAEMLPRIFEMFVQADRTLERSHGGLGIGLTLVKRLVDMHGGTIDVKSEVGVRTEFTIRLPIALGPAPAGPPREKAPQPTTSVRLRILVVDDNADSADSLSIVLTLDGNEVRTAYRGLEAIDVAREFRPDAILLDIGLPELNGYDVCRRIREETWGKEPILIALTGWGQSEARRQTRDAGFDHHVVKPADPVLLMAEVQKLHAAKTGGSNPVGAAT